MTLRFSAEQLLPEIRKAGQEQNGEVEEIPATQF